MEELRRKIKTIRRDNSNPEHRYFFPEATLFETVSESTVGPSLRDLKIPVHEVRDLADGILRGGRKCFAILVLIDCGKAIPGFFRYDGLQKSCPDDRLPYTSEGLQQIFGKDETSLAVKDFLEKQWEFAIPIMYQNMVFRKLDTQAILPFLREQPAGQGSMGTAWKVEIHPQCHRLPLENHMVIIKQIDCGERDGKVFERELKNLALLTHLKHPNIVQLYCSYTYRHKFNLIFAVADGGSLEGFLTGKQATKGLEGSQLLLALADLASAIDAMHNFTSGALDLSLSGCHHDLAPRNILVHGDTLLLADFGLSTLKNAEEDSLTTFKEVRGSYVAPECQTILPDGQIKSEEIRRASDIWSFGCILSEVLTYMMRGPDGVAMFRDKRKFEVRSELIWRRFHKGPGSPSTQVSSWLDDLEADGEPFCVRLVTLIREMLSMDPSKRPRSVRVMTVLRGITILSLAGHVQRALNGPRTAYPSADRILDKMRFQSWLFAFDRLLDKVDQDNREQLDFDFARTVEILKETRRILEYSAGEADGVNYQRPSLLRYQHAKLMESLHPDYRSIATGQLVSQVLRTKDVEQLTEFSRAIDQTGEKDIGALLAAKRLTELATNGRLFDRPELILDPRTITVNHRLDDIHSLASLKNSSEDVVIEWLRYGEHWADNEIGPELRRRLASVAGLLFAGSTTRIPGTLYCKGVFHDPSNQAFGVVYDRPQGTKPVTLHRLIDEGRRYLPSLEDRLRLAVDICRCIYTFHKIGWLHRNLHSMNVLFFPQDGIKDAKWAQEPRILGFAYGRENAIDSFTNGPDDDVQLRKYQHPKYLTHRERYREEFDYYSVGMILLEIGHWQTLSKLTETRGFQGKSEEQFGRRVIANRVPDLALNMGTRYMEATRRCLEGDFVESSGNLGKESWYSSFQNLVINRIPLME